ncbi:hypothetical protein CRENBAI_011551 [Crenichthys baileyi]|uniref:Uncharacterized protein n=1 Tax=Crenichthys baileyi TaxID=28760 RepID=A0AAV9SL86_9TELE
MENPYGTQMTHLHPKALHEWSQGPRLTPIGTPFRQAPTKDEGIGTSIGRKVRDRDHAPRTDRKPGPTPKSPKPATSALQHPHTEARATMHRTTAPTPQHAKQWRKQLSNEHPKQKPCTKLTPYKCAPTSPPKTKPPAKLHPHEKNTHSIQVQEQVRTPIPLPEVAPRENPHPSPQKAESPQSQNQSPPRCRD